MENKEKIKNFFNEYIFGYIKSDIERELNLVKAGENAGNYLMALGLMCYTEFLGSLMTGEKNGFSKENFNNFLYFMGEEYEAADIQFNNIYGEGIYSLFRCGLVHEFFIKKRSLVSIYRNGEGIGLGISENRLTIAVSKYFDDFLSASERFYNSLMKANDADDSIIKCMEIIGDK